MWLQFFASYLETRSGFVVVAGFMSNEIPLADMVFQVTVLGPDLWNFFFSSILQVALNHGTPAAFANDLNIFDVFDCRVPLATVFEKM